MITTPFASVPLLTLLRLALALVAVCILAAPLSAAPKGYKTYIVGNAADAPQSPTLSPGLVLMGGGTDVDAAFQWMCQRAGGGDFLVIRTTGTGAYNPYIQQLCPQMDSVETIVISSVAGANSAYVSSHIQTQRPSGSQAVTSRHTPPYGAALPCRPGLTIFSIPRELRLGGPAPVWPYSVNSSTPEPWAR